MDVYLYAKVAAVLAAAAWYLEFSYVVVYAFGSVFALTYGSYALLSFTRSLFFQNKKKDVLTIGFFHPYCDAGGGGERVLWCALQSLAQGAAKGRPLRAVIYTGDGHRTPDEILKRAIDLFGLTMPDTLTIDFVFIQQRRLLEASLYPRLTLLGQSVGSMLVAWECLTKAVPDVWCDTTGAAFTFPIARLAGVPHISCYVHYPTVSTDMLAKVQEQRPDYNNTGAIAQSQVLTQGKVLYYKVVAWLYGLAGGVADVVLVNSRWTQAHIAQLWGLQVEGQGVGAQAGRQGAAGQESSIVAWLMGRTHSPSVHSFRSPYAHVVYPPCSTDILAGLALGGREPLILSVAQFRPEKDHALQLRAFKEMLGLLSKESLPSEGSTLPRLLLIGGARDEGDRARVEALKELACKELGLELGQGPGQVDFAVNLPLSELRSTLGRALIGLHSMWNEHFGIGVVEMMAAGVVTIAHDSGGPKADIIGPGYRGAKVGYLATTPSQYAEAMASILKTYYTAQGSGGEGGADAPALLGMTRAARDSSARFSDHHFRTAFYANMAGLLRAASAGGKGKNE